MNKMPSSLTWVLIACALTVIAGSRVLYSNTDLAVEHKLSWRNHEAASQVAASDDDDELAATARLDRLFHAKSRSTAASYHLHTNPENFAEAKAICHAMGQTLMLVKDASVVAAEPWVLMRNMHSQFALWAAPQSPSSKDCLSVSALAAAASSDCEVELPFICDGPDAESSPYVQAATYLYDMFSQRMSYNDASLSCKAWSQVAQDGDMARAVGPHAAQLCGAAGQDCWVTEPHMGDSTVHTCLRYMSRTKTVERVADCTAHLPFVCTTRQLVMDD